MTRRLLITGGSGLLGVNWARAASSGHEIILGIHSRNIDTPGFRTARLSLESPEAVGRTLDDLRPDVVVHTAGLTNVEACEADPGLARRINVELSEHVAKACAKRGLQMVHISTDHLFAGDGSMLDETCAPAPLNVYGRTKAEAEAKVMASHGGALVVRTNFYGWGTSYRQSFSDWIIQGLRARKELTLFGDVHFTPILAETLVNAVHELVEKAQSGIVNVVGDTRISKLGFAQMLAETFTLDASLIKAGNLADMPTTVRRPRDMSLSNAKARALLGRNLGGIDGHLAALKQQEANMTKRLSV